MTSRPAVVDASTPHRPQADPAAHVVSVNVGRAAPNPYKSTASTGIGKIPQVGPIQVRAPGAKQGGLGSGVVGDHIGDRQHHGGDDQAVYAFGRDDLDRWQLELGRDLPDGVFGENLTTAGVDLAACQLGERWRIGGAELVVTVPRIPCSTFRGWLDVRGWLPRFTSDGRPGTYLGVAVPGAICAGDRIELLHRPEHGVTVASAFRALTTDPQGLADLLAAGPDLVPELRASAIAARDR